MVTSVTVKGEPRKSNTVLSNWTSGRPPDSVMDFQLTFEEGQARPFVKVTSYTWQSQCRSRHQRRSRHLEKAARCFHAWPLQDLSLRLISLVRFRRDSRLTLKKVKSDCFRRSLPIRTSENINAKDNISPFWALRMSGLNLEKYTVLSSWTSGRPARFRHGLPTDFGEGQARLFEKVTSHFRQGQCRSGTSEKVSVEGNSWQVEYSPLWRSRVNLEKSHTVLSCWTSGRPPDSRHGFPTDFWRRSSVTVCEAYILHLTKSMPDQDIREGQNISKKVTRCFHAWLLQILSLRLISLARIPLDSVRFRRLHPTDSTTIFDQADDYQEKASLSVSEAGPAWKIQKGSSRKSAAGTVPTVFGSKCRPQLWETTARLCFWDMFAFSIGGGWGRDLCPQQMNRWWHAKETEVESVGQSMRDRENLHKILEREAESSIQGGEWSSEKIIIDWSWCGN